MGLDTGKTLIHLFYLGGGSVICSTFGDVNVYRITFRFSDTSIPVIQREPPQAWGVSLSAICHCKGSKIYWLVGESPYSLIDTWWCLLELDDRLVGDWQPSATRPFSEENARPFHKKNSSRSKTRELHRVVYTYSTIHGKLATQSAEVPLLRRIDSSHWSLKVVTKRHWLGTLKQTASLTLKNRQKSKKDCTSP